jgi:hypothetical protein
MEKFPVLNLNFIQMHCSSFLKQKHTLAKNFQLLFLFQLRKTKVNSPERLFLLISIHSSSNKTFVKA